MLACSIEIYRDRPVSFPEVEALQALTVEGQAALALDLPCAAGQ